MGSSTGLASFPVSLADKPLCLSAAGILMAFVVAATVTLVVDFLYDRGIEEASRSAANLSYVISYQANRSLQTVSLAVSDVVERLQNAGVNSTADLESLGEGKDIQAMLRDRAGARVIN